MLLMSPFASRSLPELKQLIFKRRKGTYFKPFDTNKATLRSRYVQEPS